MPCQFHCASCTAPIPLWQLHCASCIGRLFPWYPLPFSSGSERCYEIIKIGVKHIFLPVSTHLFYFSYLSTGRANGLPPPENLEKPSKRPLTPSKRLLHRLHKLISPVVCPCATPAQAYISGGLYLCDTCTSLYLRWFVSVQPLHKLISPVVCTCATPAQGHSTTSSSLVCYVSG
jgi:hypothetical protein